MKNRYILFASKGVARIAEGKINAPGPDQVLVKTIKTLISPGTELAYFEGRHSDFETGKTKFPCGAPGYSNTGMIERIGKGVTDFCPGEKVFSFGGHAERCLINTNYVTKIPEGIDDEQAVFTTLGSIAIHGIRGINLRIGETLLILGQGLIGQITLRLAKFSGVEIIIVADLYGERLAISKQGGADYTVEMGKMNLGDEVERITSGYGCNAVIEASGNPKAIISALKVAANKGRILILGCPHGKVELDLYTELQRKELSLIGSYQPNCPQVETPYYPWTQQQNRRTILRYLKEGKIKFSELITHRMAFHRAQEIYTLLSAHKDKALGAIIEWEKAK